MPDELRPDETRVLGVLIEKSLSQPAYYPMTLNAITAACNQKSNRDPVANYSESDVGDALATLRKKQLVTQAEPERGSRAVRFRHEAEARYGWNAAQRAIMAELMLRGPQTLGELRTRASRMTHLESQEYARELLRALESGEPPIVIELPREPGKSARRFAHLLGGELHVTSSTTAHFVAPSPTAAQAGPASSHAAQSERALQQGATGNLQPVPKSIAVRADPPQANRAAPELQSIRAFESHAGPAQVDLRSPASGRSEIGPAPSTSDISARLQLLEQQVANLHASLAGLRDTLRQAGIEA